MKKEYKILERKRAFTIAAVLTFICVLIMLINIISGAIRSPFSMKSMSLFRWISILAYLFFGISALKFYNKKLYLLSIPIIYFIIRTFESSYNVYIGTTVTDYFTINRIPSIINNIIGITVFILFAYIMINRNRKVILTLIVLLYVRLAAIIYSAYHIITITAKLSDIKIDMSYIISLIQTILPNILFPIALLIITLSLYQDYKFSNSEGINN